MKTLTGNIQWFDNDEGTVNCNEDGRTYYMHVTAIANESEVSKMKRGAKVEFTLYTNLYMSQVDTIALVNHHPSKGVTTC